MGLRTRLYAQAGEDLPARGHRPDHNHRLPAAASPDVAEHGGYGGHARLAARARAPYAAIRDVGERDRAIYRDTPRKAAGGRRRVPTSFVRGIGLDPQSSRARSQDGLQSPQGERGTQRDSAHRRDEYGSEQLARDQADPG